MSATCCSARFILVCCLSFMLTVEATNPDELYFTDLDRIQLFNRTTARVIFQDAKKVTEALECNICDQRIYWVELPDKIKRGTPGNQSSVETIIDRDLVNPRGLALDWKGNNIYFSHSRGGSQGRIEVASCDGRHRRVVLQNLMDPGSVAINLQTGHLYYVTQSRIINRSHLDGTTSEQVHNSALETLFSGTESYVIIGLAVDAQNRLYWTAQNQTIIRYINMTEWEVDRDVTAPPNIIQVFNRPYELLVTNDLLYFTELRVMTETAQIVSPGALYSFHMDSQNVSTLLSNSTISPHDICTFYYNTTSDDMTGCSNNNGGCQVFCFTVPDGHGGTQPQCGCPTGIQLKNGTECLEFPDKFLLATHVLVSDEPHSEIRQVSLDIPGSYTDVMVPVDIRGTEASHITYDLVYHKIYWTELDPPLIRRANLNGSNPEIFINFSLGSPQDLAVDPFSRNLFWMDAGLDRIEVARLDNGRIRKVLIDTDLDHPQGLALDTKNEYFYWTDLDLTRPRIECARMNGSDRRVVSSSHEIRRPVNIAVDPLTGNVYWVDVKAHIVMYDGVRDVLVVSNGIRDAFGLAVLGDFVYWTDRAGGISDALWKADKYNGMDRTSLLGGGFGLRGLVAVNVSAETVNVNCRVVEGGDVLRSECRQFCLGTTCGCADYYNILPDGQCEDPRPLIFAATPNNVAVLIGPSAPTSGEVWTEDYDLDISAVAIDVDFKENKIYWISSTDGHIYRRSAERSTNSSHDEDIISCCRGNITDLAVDWYGRNLYWVDPVKRVIELSKLNGKGRIVLSVIPESYGAPVALVLDPMRGDLYWTPQTPPIIYRTKMYSPSVEETTVFWDGNENDTIAGMALSNFSIESSRDFLYWGVNHPDNMATIMMQDITSPVSSAGVVVRHSNSAMLNVEAFREQFYYQFKPRFSFPGSPLRQIKRDDNNDVITNSITSPLTDFKIIHHSVQPGAHRCGVKNGGCGGDALCLVEDGSNHVCRCPPQFEPRLETNDAGEEHLSCYDSDSFLLLATNNTIHYLPVDRPSTLATPTPLPLGVVKDIKVLAYDPVNKSVLWMSRNASFVHSVAVNSSFNHDIPLATNETIFPQSFAYDWLGGHLFVTESNSFSIEAMNINGPGLSSLLDFSSVKPVDLGLIGEIAYNQNENTLYWTTLDPITNFGRDLNFMSLLPNHRPTKKNFTNTRIDKMTFEPKTKSLIWINRNHDSNHTIEIYDVDDQAVTVITGLANGVQALTTIPEENRSSFALYWYNTTDHMIYRYNSTTGRYSEYLSWESPGDIVGFVGHRTGPIPASRPCLASPRPCSHLCLPDNSPSDHQCVCPPHRELTSDGATCSDVACSESSGLLTSCGGDFGICIPRTYFCDGIAHCHNGEDEATCPCNTTSELTCYNSNKCFPFSSRCNGTSECPGGEDEDPNICCNSSNQFGCYVSAGDNFPSRNGVYYTCYEINLVCDGQIDCLDGSDEICPTVLTDTPPTNKPATKFNELTLIIVLVVGTSVPILILLSVCTCYLFKRLKSKTEQLGINRTMIPVGHEMNPRTDSQSEEYISEYSENTDSTVLNVRNGSSFGSVFKRHLADGHSVFSGHGPPPSLVTNPKDQLAEIESALDGDNHTILSVPMSQASDEDMSDYPIIPPAPCPSINYSEYDTMSAVTHMSSVSQRRFAGAPVNNGMPIGVDGRGGGGGGGNMGGKNPLQNYPEMNGNAFHHQSRYASMAHYYQHHHHQRMASTNARGGGGGSSGGSVVSGKGDPLSHTHYHYQEGEVPRNHSKTLQGNGIISRKELDSITRTETESTMSMTTENEELQEVFNEDHIPGAPPPGRPPSPVTECSEYPPPLSPDSTTTYEEDSDEYLSRYSHHH